MWLLLKNSTKKVFKSFGRFISISLIILIGIGVFVGLRESTPGMLHTADNYYDELELMDYKISSTYGLDTNDINALKNLQNIAKVIPSYSLDILIEGKSVRMHSIEEINKVNLVDGKMPQNINECLGDYQEFQIKDTLEFHNEYLNVSKCEIVGLIKSPLYLNNNYGISNTGNGQLKSFIFVLPDTFNLEYYTEVYLIAKNSQKTSSYSEKYQKSIEKLHKELVNLKPIRETLKYEEVLQKANDEIAKIEADLSTEISKNSNKLANVKKELDNNNYKLKQTKKQTISKLSNSYDNLIKEKENLIQELANYHISYNDIDSSINNLNNEINNLKELINSISKDDIRYEELNSTLASLNSQYNNLVMLKNAIIEIDDGLIKLNVEKQKFLDTIEKQENKLEKGYNEYNEGITKLENAKKDANEKIAKAKEEVTKIAKPIWYLQDRTSNPGYQNYYDDAIKVAAISKILPVFFIIVVMLMCLNTLTRLIEEERGEIGILQSNGFSKANIIFSYLLYVLSSTLIGIFLGLSLGYGIITKVIYSVFTSNYNLPKFLSKVDQISLILIILITIVLMFTITIIACSKELKDKPAELLRPKAPKNGKKVFLERFKKIWNRLNFMNKITIRNLFRYKKRITMTILGVAGCTALLLTGFGLNDSINIISKIQYNSIIKYDSQIILKEEVTNISPAINNLLTNNKITNYLLLSQNAYKYSYDNKEETVYIIVPNNQNKLNDFVELSSTINKKSVQIHEKGAIITSQMAEQLQVTKNGFIKIRNSDNELFIFQVKDVVENYISHYIYMSSTYYEEVFKKEVKYNNIVTNKEIKSPIELNDYDIYAINNTKDIIETFDTFIKSINNLIILIIGCACLLVFAVIYNLTIINVNERKREIATFKVLGFNNFEIFIFIYRETFILTIIGILLGFGLGIFLHHFVVATAQTGSVQFLYNIFWYSYIFSAIITIIFSLLVQLLINRTIKNIDMIDSLKSVE